MQYRKKPVVIEAFQWDGKLNLRGTGWPDWLKDAERAEVVQQTFEGYLTIRTLEGDHRAQPGDWIIRGVKGELYPCKPDIFAATYESAEIDLDAADFSDALMWLKEGKRVQRAGWNGKGMWLKLVPTDIADKVAFEYAALDAAPWIGMKTADDKFVPWLASQTDMLATDWQVVK